MPFDAGSSFKGVTELGIANLHKEFWGFMRTSLFFILARFCLLAKAFLLILISSLATLYGPKISFLFKYYKFHLSDTEILRAPLKLCRFPRI